MHELSSRVALAAAVFVTALLTPAEARAGDEPLPLPDLRLGSGERTEPRWQLEWLHLRFAIFDQRGHGYQSQAISGDQARDPGSEKVEVMQPMALLRIRQNARVTHDISLPVDVISSASANALDAVSAASLLSEGGDIDVTTTYTRNDDEQVSARYGFHIEETMRAWYAGVGWQRELAEDNATFSLNAIGIVDYFDDLRINGFLVDRVFRYTGSINASLSQLLSPTTVVSASYGVTYQSGRLERTWNSVPVSGPSVARYPELLPGTRLRHAASGWLFQHVPQTRSTFKLGYRYYHDDFGLDAHTVEARFYQYLGSRVIARASYRFYRQTGVDFFTTGLPLGMGTAIKTADSDLAPFDAHEVGAKLTFYFTPIGPVWRSRRAFNVSYFRYARDNDLAIDAVSFGYQQHY